MNVLPEGPNTNENVDSQWFRDNYMNGMTGQEWGDLARQLNKAATKGHSLQRVITNLSKNQAVINQRMLTSQQNQTTKGPT